MSKKITEIQGIVSRALNELPQVFSTVQWGGRAYKVGSARKFKLLAHTWISRQGDALHIDLKLQKKRAADVVKRFAWINRHSFRTLGSSGWITCEIRTKTQAKAVIPLLSESHAMYPINSEEKQMRSRERDSEVEIVVRTMDAVLSRKKAEGWRPIHDDGFDD